MRACQVYPEARGGIREDTAGWSPNKFAKRLLVDVPMRVRGEVHPATVAQGEVTPCWTETVGLFSAVSSLEGEDGWGGGRAGRGGWGGWDHVMSPEGEDGAELEKPLADEAGVGG